MRITPPARNVQPHVHAARGGDDFPVHHPGVPAALGNFVLPLMLGAKDVAFPRLNLASFYLLWFGASFFVVTLLLGGLDTGWTFYTPYSTDDRHEPCPAVDRRVHLGLQLDFHGLNFIVIDPHPAAAGHDLVQNAAVPLGALRHGHHSGAGHAGAGHHAAAVGVERMFGLGIFDPETRRRSDPLPALLLVLFASGRVHHDPAGMGIISEVISVFSRKHIFGYRFIAFSSVAIALFGFLVWGHHMFVSGTVVAGQHDLQRHDLRRGDSLGDQGLQLAGHDVQRLDLAGHADVLRA